MNPQDYTANINISVYFRTSFKCTVQIVVLAMKYKERGGGKGGCRTEKLFLVGIEPYELPYATQARQQCTQSFFIICIYLDWSLVPANPYMAFD